MMHKLVAMLALLFTVAQSLAALEHHRFDAGLVQLGLRPQKLVSDLAAGPLKNQLQECLRSKNSFRPVNFSIGHRGAPLLFPEHTAESYRAAAAMGAGIVECDVTFTQDRQLVCRHDQCDLHNTTNILETPLVKRCTASSGRLSNGERQAVQCCTSDITLAEFKSLEGKLDITYPNTLSGDELLEATSPLRQILALERVGTPLSLTEALTLFRELNVGVALELKTPRVAMPFQGDYTQQDFAEQVVSELEAAGIKADRVWLQSFSYHDVVYWVNEHPRYSRRAVFLDNRYETDVNSLEAVLSLNPSLSQIASDGIQTVAPPLFMLLDVDGGTIVPSVYARRARAVGLNLITWTVERSGSLQDGGGFYYSTVQDAISSDGDILTVIDVLAQRVGVMGIFSDWPSTTTFYANCISTL